MKIDVSKFRAKPDHKVRLSDWPTSVKPFYDSKSEYEELLADHIKKLSERQGLLYANDRYSLLLVFQAMDAGGKDGAIKHVMSGVNPQGCQVHSFKTPSKEELQHDFLWRTTRRLPERGHIGIFNRSYYEEVLIAKVHPEILQGQDLPEEDQADPDIWEKRYRSIAEFEKHLHCNGTHVVKFFLHISKEEQRKRFLSRIDDPDKNWKLTMDDISERERWKDYQRAYEECVAETGTKFAPWYIVPGDDKKNVRLIISQVIVETLDGLPLKYPSTNKAHKKELEAIRKKLEEE